MRDKRRNQPGDDEFDYEPTRSYDPSPQEQLETLWREREYGVMKRAALIMRLKLYGLLISIATGLGMLASTLASLWPGRIK
jgi:hypothetical protein